MRNYGTRGTCSNTTAACILVALATLLTPAPSGAQTPPSFTISTIAGNGTAGFAGDGGPATAAQLNNPCSLLVDGSGNIFIGDQVNYRIRKITPDGNINTVVGNGTSGDSGSGGAATSAEIRSPCGLALDGSGNLYLSDTGSFKIKKFAGANVTDYAGDGTGGYLGDGQTPLSTAEFNNPTGLALDASGNLYIGDSGNDVIREITSSGALSTFAGQTNSGLAIPGYLGDGGPASQAQFDNPTGLVFDPAGNLYVVDTDNGVIRKITPGGGTITTIAGNGGNGYSGDGGPATSAMLNHPRSIALDAAGNIYIADTDNNRIRVVLPTGQIYTVAGTGRIGNSGDGGPATGAALSFPTAVAVARSGNVYVADTQNSDIRLLTLNAIPSASPAVSSVISASQFGSLTAVAPGSWIEIYGSNLAVDARAWTTADFNGTNAPISLDQTSVTVGGQNAVVSYISPRQVNVQIPNVGPGSQPLVVKGANGSSAPFTITVKSTDAGLWAPAALLASGKQYTAVFNDNSGAFVMPAGAVSGVNSRAAHVGDTIVLWGIGFGSVTPNEGSGAIVESMNALTTPVQFTVGGQPATTMYAGLAPQEIGLYQFNLVVPNVAPGAAIPVTFSQGGVAATQTVYIAVQ